ncbi:MAG: GxxExxY protein [Phycisphaerales bacterium]|nr:GxxExxY protein [Phycisphaerales bacterium]
MVAAPDLDEKRIFELCDVIRETSFALHRFLRHGHMEAVYENGLANRLIKSGLTVEQQHPLTVCDEDGTELGQYFADLLVEEQIIVEVKAKAAIIDAHIAQILGYLRGCRIRHGLLINFGTPRLFVKKLVLDPI